MQQGFSGHAAPVLNYRWMGYPAERLCWGSFVMNGEVEPQINLFALIRVNSRKKRDPIGKRDAKDQDQPRSSQTLQT